MSLLHREYWYIYLVGGMYVSHAPSDEWQTELSQCFCLHMTVKFDVQILFVLKCPDFNTNYHVYLCFPLQGTRAHIPCLR